MPMSAPNSGTSSAQPAATGSAAADDEEEVLIREIHALTPPRSLQQRPLARGGERDSSSSWDGAGGLRSPAVRSIARSETVSSEGFTTMSREFNAMVLAGSDLHGGGGNGDGGVGDGMGHNNLRRIGEDYGEVDDTNPLAIIPDMNPVSSPRRSPATGGALAVAAPALGDGEGEVSVHRVVKEEVESKISAWQTAKIAKVNNRFKRDDVVINGWENAQVEKATAVLKKIERKLDEERAKALERSQNDIARSRRKAEERRAEAESKRGKKVAKILELANTMRALGRAPSRRSFF